MVLVAPSYYQARKGRKSFLMNPNPVPSSVPAPFQRPTQVVIDDPEAVAALVASLIDRSGRPISQLAAEMGITKQALAQYKYGYRSRPSIKWLARLAQVCGGRLVVEFPY